jgi:hypothetical protein
MLFSESTSAQALKILKNHKKLAWPVMTWGGAAKSSFSAPPCYRLHFRP